MTTYLAFWHLSLANFAEGGFSMRLISAHEARELIDNARRSDSLRCVVEADLAAPYRDRERRNHEALCAALADHCGIQLSIDDFFEPTYARPLCIARVDEASRLLVVDCAYKFPDGDRPDTRAEVAAAVAAGDFESARAVVRRTRLQFAIATESIRFHLFEARAE